MRQKPKIGISACLLGQAVRFDGGHKKSDWIVDELGKWATFHPLCPEVEMGLGIPRESLRLMRPSVAAGIRLITNKTEQDITPNASRVTKKMVADLPELEGFILKKNSPSCGLERVKVYDRNHIPVLAGQGVFAARLQAAHPGLPLIEEGRLTDPEQREHFVTRVFAYHRWRAVPAKTAAIQKFHQHYKLLFMAHSPLHYQQLGKLAANSDKGDAAVMREKYEKLFLEALAKPTTTRKRVNVLQHIFGYFRGKINDRQKEDLMEALEEFRNEELGFQAVLKLAQHVAKSLDIPYLKEQLFFSPYPKSLGLQRFL